MGVGSTKSSSANSLTSAYQKPKARRNRLSSDVSRSNRNQEIQNKEIQRRRVAAEKAVERTERESRQEIDRIREEYSKQAVNEQARQEAAYEKQRSEGYERLENLKRKQREQIAKARVEGERQLAKTEEASRAHIAQTEFDGNKRSREIQEAYQKQQELQDQKNKNKLIFSESQGQSAIENKRQVQQTRLHELEKNSNKLYEKHRSHHAKRSEETKKFYDQRFKDTIARSETEIDQIHSKASQQIREIRDSTARNLAAYSERQSDPFYKLVDMNVDFRDDGDAFILTARIPEHEQDNISINVNNNLLTISGTRRNNEKLEIGPSQTRQTASFQSFTETFPVDHPVEAQFLSRHFDGDLLTVVLPKKGVEGYKMHQAPEPAPVRAKAPQFPENLPKVEKETEPEPNETIGHKKPRFSPLG